MSKRSLTWSFAFLGLALLLMALGWWLGTKTFIPSWKDKSGPLISWTLIAAIGCALVSGICWVAGSLRSKSERNAAFWVRVILIPLFEFCGITAAVFFLLLVGLMHRGSMWTEHVYVDMLICDDGTVLYLHNRVSALPGDRPPEKDYAIWAQASALPFMEYADEAEEGAGQVIVDEKAYRFRIMTTGSSIKFLEN